MDGEYKEHYTGAKTKAQTIQGTLQRNSCGESLSSFRNADSTRSKCDCAHRIAMICENCHHNTATVHIEWLRNAADTGTQQLPERGVHHFCGACADALKSSNPLLNPRLLTEPGAETIKLRVLSLSSDRIVVRRVDKQAGVAEWSLLTSRIPAPYAVIGMEFEVTVTETQLKYLKGED